MGKKSQPAPPAPVDPANAIRAQAEVNRINQYTPYGSLTFSDGGPSGDPTGQAGQAFGEGRGLAGRLGAALSQMGVGQTAGGSGSGRSSATLTLSPELQQLFDLQIGSDTGLLELANQALGPGGIQDLIGSPLSTQGLPGITGDFGQRQDEAERAFFDRSRGLLDEQFQTEEERLRQRLANQGTQAGNEGYNQELGIFNQRRGDTFENLARDAVLFGGQEASRGLADQGRLRSQLFSEQGATRANQFNELASLLGLQQVAQPGLQNFFGPGQVDALGAYGLQQQGLQNNYNTQSRAASQAKGATADLLGNLGGAAFGAFSDRRLKQNIEQVGTYRGHNWYVWKWNDKARELGLEGAGMGVMADEVAPKTLVGGYWQVDYGRL